MLGGRPDADFMQGLLDFMVGDHSDYIPRLTLGPNLQMGGRCAPFENNE